MEPINRSLSKWMRENEDFQARYQKMRETILQDPEIKRFLAKHPDITDKAITKHLNQLYEYMNQSKECDRCASLAQCCNVVPGLTPTLLWDNNEIHIRYEKCHTKIADEQMAEKQKLIHSLYMPKEILAAQLTHIDYDAKRKTAFYETNRFLEEAQQTLPRKGIYFTGPFGVGKTFFLGAIANRLSELDYSSTLIYMPEFVHEMREAIKTNTVQEKMDVFKHTDVLMFDDIGAETLSPWFRDEVLGSILQYRMNERLPVFFTSNYTMEQLEEILSTTSKGDVERVKAGRIMERIKQLSTEVEIGGYNRRS